MMISMQIHRVYCCSKYCKNLENVSLFNLSIITVLHVCVL